MGLEAVLLDIKVPERVETDIVNVVWKVILKSDAQVYERFLGGEDINLKQYTTYKAGGIGKVLVIPNSINDLVKLLKGMLCHVNLINVNFVEERGLMPTTPERVKRFSDILTSRGINTTLRRSLGKEINAACGQLRQTAMKEK